MKYTVVVHEISDGEANTFEEAVEEMLLSGWQLQGGISVVKVGEHGDSSIYAGGAIYRYHQALTKTELGAL